MDRFRRSLLPLLLVVSLLPLACAGTAWRQALREERMLIDSLPGYAEYCSRTKRFLPFLV